MWDPDAGGWVWSAIVETLLLFGAFFFLLPCIPSNEMPYPSLLPTAAFAWALFAASRALRWRRRWPMLLLELPLFVIFTSGLHDAIGLLWPYHP